MHYAWKQNIYINIRLSFKIELSSQLTESQGFLLHQAMSRRHIRQFAEF